MSEPTVSIVMPTFNGAATLPALLDGIQRQRVEFPVEVIAVDSGSTDGTVDLLRSRGAHVFGLDGATFNHGLTRNQGVARARGEFVVMMVQDAEPVSDTWLAALVAPFAGDARLAGTFARQAPRDDAGPITRHYLSRWIAAQPAPRVVEIDGHAALQALTPAERLDRCAFDDVCSCIRRSVWTRHPFPAAPFGEDLAWARAVLLAGYRLQYVPDAVVRHSHDRTVWDEYTRTRISHEQLYELFELRTIPTLPKLAFAWVSTLALHARLHRGGPPSFARAMGWALAWPLGQYVGGRAAARRRRAGKPAGT